MEAAVGAAKIAFDAALEVLFPKKEAVLAFENMSPAEFAAAAAGPLPPVDDLGAVDALHVLFPYKRAENSVVKDAVWQIKYMQNARVAALFAPTLEATLAAILARASSPFLIIPAPLSKARRRVRGYNQIEFTLSFTSFAHTHVRGNILQKVRHTDAQSHTDSRDDRLENLAGAFRVADPAVVRGTTIILCDDVYTTGATLHSMALALKSAGAARVIGLCLAH